MPRKFVFVAILLIALAGVAFFLTREKDTPAEVIPTQIVETLPTQVPARTPELIPIEDSPLKEAVIAAGDYLVRQQLTNGELSYQVNILNNDRSSTPSDIRLIAGTGSLYTVCRVSGDEKYCEAGDLALDHYLEMLVSAPESFKGTCLYTNGGCPLGGAALTVDAIYKRWQATGSFFMDEHNLLNTAMDLGYFIVSMRKPEGGFYHSFDPHFAGTVDPNYFVIYFPGESLYALLQLYEMTGNAFWLEQAHEVNEFMITQPVTEDHWHGYAFAMFARLDALEKSDIDYANQIADTIIDGQVRSLNPANTSISTSTKMEALSALAQSFFLSDVEHERLDREIRTFITFVRARQLPADNCNFDLSQDALLRYQGGVFSSCEDPSIRVDGVQHWINGVTAFLEYQSMIGAK
jgi:hypothetical protein